jgi:hypothetical protein
MPDQNVLEKLWQTIQGWAERNADQYLYAPVPKDRTDATYDAASLQPLRSYFRVWLCEMFLTKSRTWFKDWYPAVNCSVQLKFGDKDSVNFTRVAQPPKESLAWGVQLNYRMTELLPFNGGVVEIEAALMALEGKDYLATVIDVLQDFSSLVAAPLGQVLNVAEKVNKGVQSIFGATAGEVHLALHQSFVSAGGGGGNELKPGYLAVILANANQVAAERLSVKEDRLYYRAKPGSPPTPFTGYDYMLFRIEGRPERDDWRLKNIEEPLNKAVEATLQGEAEKAKAYKTVALATALQSPDLAVYDRRRVVQAIKEELAAIEAGGLGAVGDEIRDLNHIVSARAVSMDQAAALGEMSFEELFAD